MFHKCLVESSTTCGFGFKDVSFKTVCSTSAWWIFPRPVVFCSGLEDTKQGVPQVPGGFFHDLWSLLQKIMCKTECSIGDLWIFPQPVDFLARSVKITWTHKDLKGKENIKRRDRGK